METLEIKGDNYFGRYDPRNITILYLSKRKALYLG